MPLSRDFKTTICERVRQDPLFGEEFFKEAVECLLSGDLETGKAILRDYINATVGFQKLGDLTQRPAKSLMRMFRPKGNPRARNVFEVIGWVAMKSLLTGAVVRHPPAAKSVHIVSFQIEAQAVGALVAVW